MARNRSNRQLGQQAIGTAIRVNKAPVRRRRVVYIAGYDPRPPEGAKYDLLKREAERFCAREGLACEITAPVHAEDGATASWTLSLSGPDWRTQAEYLFLRWDDIVAADFQHGFFSRLARAAVIFFDYLATGTIARMGKTFHRTLFLWLYPFLATGGMVIASVVAGLWVMRLTGGPWSWLAGCAATAAVLAAGAWLSRRTFIQHLLDLWRFCRDFGIGARPDMEARCERFADKILEAVRRGDVEETLLVGHSYGAMMILEATARALARDEGAFAAGAPVTLITLGSCVNTSTLHPRAEARRETVRRIARSDSLLWVDVQGRQDMINYYQDDAAVAAGLLADDARTNPVVRRLSLSQLLGDKLYNRFRLNYFRLHYQTICANVRPHPWEYVLVVAGPQPLADRLDLRHWQAVGADPDRYAGAHLPNPPSARLAE